MSAVRVGVPITKAFPFQYKMGEIPVGVPGKES